MRRGAAVLVAALATAGPAAAEEARLSFGDVSVELSGHVNLGVLNFRDGVTGRTWAPVDNDHSSSRARLAAIWEGEAVEVTGRVEVEYQPRAAGAVSIVEGGGWDWSFGRENIRLLEVGIERQEWGALWLGQGDMASEDVVEDTDLSGTSVAAQASVQDIAAAQVFRLAGGGVSGTAVGDAFDDFDGLGRAVRLRYDAPAVAGLELSVAYGQDRLVGRSGADLVDIGLRTEAEGEAVEWRAAAGLGWEGGARVLAGAVSGLHKETGISLTVAAGERDGRYGWAKLGWQRDLVGAGRTHLSLDHFRGGDIADDGARSRSWGLAAVQAVEAWDTELWVVVRRYGLSGEGVPTRSARLVFAGARWSF